MRTSEPGPDPPADPPPAAAPATGIPGRMLLAVWAVAALLRLLHNEALLADPLHFTPLGGNLPLLLAAEAIAGGDLLPFDGPISLNSPLYPYLLAGLYQIVGVNEFHSVRMVTGLLDAGTCALVAFVAFRRFGRPAGWGAGLALAAFGPMIFFATDLNPVPFTLLALVGAVALLDGPGGRARFALAGLLFGLAVATRPNVLLAAPFLLAVPWARRLPGRGALTLFLGMGLVAGIAPVTALNRAASGHFVALTTSGGHNFYIGHNPAAEAQYTLPAALDGDIFLSMKGLAERVEGRPLADAEVSGWYLRRGLAHVAEAPGREAELLARRALLLFNDFEATTYANYDYQKAWSPVLRFAPTLAWLLLLAAPGMLLAFRREMLALWLPLLAGAASVLFFFYIARLRIVMVPSLGLFAGAAVAGGAALLRRRNRRAVAAAATVGVAAFALSTLPLLHADTSNEWNKAGGVLRVAGRFEEAEAAFARAAEANPDNPNTYRNLAVLYRETGRAAAASEAEAPAARLSAGSAGDADAFRRALEGSAR